MYRTLAQRTGATNQFKGKNTRLDLVTQADAPMARPPKITAIARAAALAFARVPRDDMYRTMLYSMGIIERRPEGF